MSVHVYLLNDEKEHNTESGKCWCDPETRWVDTETKEIYPEAMIIHNAANCREVIEQAEEILK